MHQIKPLWFSFFNSSKRNGRSIIDKYINASENFYCFSHCGFDLIFKTNIVLYR